MNTARVLVVVVATVAAFALAGCASPKPEPREQANQFDLDGDCYLTKEEYSASALSDVMDFDALDANGDGLLSQRELEFRAGEGTRGRGPKGGKRPNT